MVRHKRKNFKIHFNGIDDLPGAELWGAGASPGFIRTADQGQPESALIQNRGDIV